MYRGVVKNYGLGSPGYHIKVIDPEGRIIAAGPYSDWSGIATFEEAGFREVREIKDGVWELEKIESEGEES